MSRRTSRTTTRVRGGAATAAMIGLITTTSVVVGFGAASAGAATNTVSEDVCETLTPGVVYGTPDDDVLVGTSGPDVICAFGGDDVVEGGNGADVIFGGEGDDTLRGGNDGDVVHGGNGNDAIDTGNGDDVAHGGEGDDTIHTGNGVDEVYAGAGDDVVDTGKGDDFAYGDRGDDTLVGDRGADTLIGGAGRADTADGGQASDTCSAETTVNCEIDGGGPTNIDEIPFPSSPAPISFEADSAGIDGVSLTLETAGGLYPWDVGVRPAYTTPAMQSVVVSPLVDLHKNADAPDFAGASLTLTYDESLVDEVDESNLQIWTYDDATQFWLPAGDSQTVDVEANTVTADLDHFSIYAVLEIDRTNPDSWDRVFGATPRFCVRTTTDLGADVAFVIDTSGSMGWNDPSDLRVDAAKAFVDEMGSNDRAAVVGFNSSGYIEAGLTPLDSDANRLIVAQALDRTGADGGGTNISSALANATSVLQTPEVGRPRVAILLTDGDGSYSSFYADQAAAANITVYTVGLGSAVNSSVLGDIADRTGGRFIQLTDADQLVPLYEQLSGTIFDDGTDTDGDTLTDCVETNGAFVPAVVTRASVFQYYPYSYPAEVDAAYLTLNPFDPDTDFDTYGDGVELELAQLADDPDLATVYAHLLDAGITEYYIEHSNPLDPTDPDGNPYQGDLGPLRSGLLDVEGLDLEQTTLFQPVVYPDRPSPDARLLARRVDGGVAIDNLSYDDNPVVFAENEDCLVNCEAVIAASERHRSGGFLGTGVFGCDETCAIKKIIEEARGDQRIFDSDDHASEYFIREQVALRCAILIRDLDGCVQRSFFIEYDDISLDEVDTIVGAFTANRARWLFSPTVQNAINPLAFFPLLTDGDMTRFLEYQGHLLALVQGFDAIDGLDGSNDGHVPYFTLQDDGPGVAPAGTPLGDAIRAVGADASYLSEGHFQFGVGAGSVLLLDALRWDLVRIEALLRDPSFAAEFILDYPLVEGGSSEVDIRQYDLLDDQLALAFDLAVLNSPADRTLHHALVSHLPETGSGFRNALITAMYIEYSQAVQSWLGGRVDNNWGLVAPWASAGVRGPIRGEFPAWVHTPRQAAADGNQWIFNDVGYKYASFVELIEAHPNPTESQLEQFFENTFDGNDRAIRDGFLALVAAKKEADPQRAQELLFVSNALLATHEQSGVQPYLEKLDQWFLPGSEVENWFVNLEMGAGFELHTDLDLYDQYGLAPEGPPPADNRIWNTPVLDYDPTGLSASDLYDTAGFDVEVGGGQQAGVVNVAALGGPALDPSWTAWRNAPADADLYTSSRADTWWDWEDRMWFLLNLFRITHTDPSIQTPPAGTSLSSSATLSDTHTAAVLTRLAVP